MKIGQKLRALRKEKRMTLEELSKKSKVAMATLSRIEHGLMIGTLKSHMNICKALGISLSDFYSKIENVSKNISIMRKQEKRDMFIYAKKSQTELLTTKIMDKKMMPTLISIKRNGQSHEEKNKSGSEKFVYVLSGELGVKIDTDEYHLNKGDSIYFDGSLPHVFKNVGRSRVVAFSILTPPEL